MSINYHQAHDFLEQLLRSHSREDLQQQLEPVYGLPSKVLRGSRLTPEAVHKRYGKLIDMRITVEGNHVYLDFDFTTGNAAGQNMVTIATEAICDYIKSTSPVQPQYYFVESNLSGDKKASTRSFLSVRGKKVTVEVKLKTELVSKRRHTSPEQMVNYWRMSAIGGTLSGTIGVQRHYANGLAGFSTLRGGLPLPSLSPSSKRSSQSARTWNCRHC